MEVPLCGKEKDVPLLSAADALWGSAYSLWEGGQFHAAIRHVNFLPAGCEVQPGHDAIQGLREGDACHCNQAHKRTHKSKGRIKGGSRCVLFGNILQSVQFWIQHVVCADRVSRIKRIKATYVYLTEVKIGQSFLEHRSLDHCAKHPHPTTINP